MTWSTITPPEPPKATAAGSIFISVAAAPAVPKRPRVVFLSVRSATIGPEVAWWQPGALVAVRMGEGQHAGLLRLEYVQRDGFRVRKPQGKPRPGIATSIMIPAFDWLDATRHASTVREFDYADGWLQITLPEWARRPAPAVSVPAKAPFEMVASAGVDPMVRGQLANRGLLK